MQIDDVLGFFAEDEEIANQKNGKKQTETGKITKTQTGLQIEINGQIWHCKKEHFKAMLEGKYKYAIITKTNQNSNEW